MAKAKSARQIAASKRNIRKAQIASARARKGKKRSSVSQHTYGTGRSGRKSTRRALYGSRRHGISPVQYQRRQQRSAKWKRRAGNAVSGAVIGAMVYRNLSPLTKQRLQSDARDYAHATKESKKFIGSAKNNYQFSRSAGMSRRKSAKNAAVWTGKGVRIKFGGATNSVKYRHRK